MSGRCRINPLRTFGALALSLAAFAVVGCRQDMHDQPKYIPLRPSDFFADGRSQRMPVEGTVPQNLPNRDQDPYLYTGKINGQDGTVFPFPITAKDLERGRQRYTIYCTPCHSRVGDGNGMIVRRGYRQPPNWHDDKYRNYAIGHFFDVMTNGFGAMPDYSSQVPVKDRWRIAAYIRALQLSQHATVAEVPQGEKIYGPKEEFVNVGAESTSRIPKAGTRNAPTAETPEEAAPRKEQKIQPNYPGEPKKQPTKK
jgi:mono/diheme cytochrome c family protein